MTLVLFEGRCCHLVAKRENYTERRSAPAPFSLHCLRGPLPAATPQFVAQPPTTQKSAPAFHSACGMEQEKARKWSSYRPCAGLPLHQHIDPPSNLRAFHIVVTQSCLLPAGLSPSSCEATSPGKGGSRKHPFMLQLPYENFSSSEVSLGTLTKTGTEIGWGWGGF